jgi:hypothetical protein
MIELIERDDIFANYKIIASKIAEIQKIYYDDDIYSGLEDENERIIYKNIFDAMDHDIFPLNDNEKIFTAESHMDIRTFPQKIYNLLLHFFEEISVKELFIISALKTNYFMALFNKYKHLVKAYKELEKIVGEKNYDGAFYVSNLTEEIIFIIFWLCRCCPEMDTILIFDKMERYYFNICKYGNIHFTELNGNIISNEILEKIGFKIVNGKEMDNFSEDGIIKGRRIKI